MLKKYKYKINRSKKMLNLKWSKVKDLANKQFLTSQSIISNFLNKT